MISVAEAEEAILKHIPNFGEEYVAITQAKGRFLAEDIGADRDLPPYHRVTMDGIAIQFADFEAGTSVFQIQETNYAGQPQATLSQTMHCIEVMTGAILPNNTDTVVRYEDLTIENGSAKINGNIAKDQNVHFKGQDTKQGSHLIAKGTALQAKHIAVAASVGKSEILVKKLPKVCIVSSGDELIPVHQTPLPHQIRSSNGHTIASLLANYKIDCDLLHISDHWEGTLNACASVLQNYDIMFLTGGVSMGKKDLIPKALESLGVHKHFHKISQKPGKPFWFGTTESCTVFALPGNPVSSFLCATRYVLPWLMRYFSGQRTTVPTAVLSQDIKLNLGLTHFIEAKLQTVDGQIIATPIIGNGSGDFVNLLAVDCFLECPTIEQPTVHQKGAILNYWPIG